jgi:hypothetical protein
MRYTKERQKEHISAIRRVLVIKPESSILGIKEALLKRKKPLKLDKDYINKMVRKIRAERSQRLDRYTINKTLAGFQDEINELKNRLWRIIITPETSERDKISAIKELRNSSIGLFDKMFESGVFEKKLGELNVSDKTLINKIEELSQDAKRKYYKKLAEAEDIARCDKEDREGKN